MLSREHPITKERENIQRKILLRINLNLKEIQSKNVLDTNKTESSFEISTREKLRHMRRNKREKEEI